MPSYFTIAFELIKKETIVADFYNALISSNFAFKSGYWYGENCDKNDIIKWNQDKLNSDFVLGMKEHVENDYKQILFNYYNFNEVRVFILNKKKSKTVMFYLIVPEDDLVSIQSNKDSEFVRNIDNMNLLIELAVSMWNSIKIEAIQTEWESSITPIQTSKNILNGKTPKAEPFCIVKKYKNMNYEAQKKDVGNNGILIINENGWNF